MYKYFLLVSYLFSSISYADVSFTYQSTSGNWVGEDRSGSVTYDDSSYTYQSSIDNFFLMENSGQWMFNFKVGKDKHFDKGTYTFAGLSNIKPSLDVSSDGRGCTGTGQFKVLDVGYNQDDTIKSLAIDFMYYCKPDHNSPLYGSFRFNSSVPVDLNGYIGSLNEKTSLHIDSEHGDYIGKGKEIDFANNPEAYQTYMQGNAISILAVNKSWDFNFSAPLDAAITPGYYANADKFQSSFDDPMPSMSIEGRGTSCSKVSGRFKVLQADYNDDDSIRSLAVDFEQHCEDSPDALYGELRYQSNIPSDIEMPAQFDIRKSSLSIPYAQILGEGKQVNMEVTNQAPLTFKITSIDPANISDDVIRVPAKFDGINKRIVIPEIDSVDSFGQKKLIKKIILKSQSGNFNVGDTLVIVDPVSLQQMQQFVSNNKQ